MSDTRRGAALVVALDPDSRSTAIAWARWSVDATAFVLAGLAGGGSQRVTWQSITGLRAWLQAERRELAPASVHVVCETQAPTGPQSADCEPLRRVRYHCDAACEVDGYVSVPVDADTWQRAFLRGEVVGRGAGARKVAYRRRARELTREASNEDRAAALGMLCWYVSSLGAPLKIG